MRTEKEVREVLDFYERAFEVAEKRYILAQSGKIPALTVPLRLGLM